MANFSDDFNTLSAGTLLNTRSGWADHPSYTVAKFIGTTIPTGTVRTDTGSGSAAAHAYASADPGSADYYVSVDLLFPAVIESGDAIGVTIRVDIAADTYYRAQWEENGGSNRINIYKTVAGSTTLVGLAGTATATGSSTHNVFISATGNSLQVKWDGSNLGSAQTDSSISAGGRAGIIQYAQGATGATDAGGIRIDNFVMVGSASGATAFTETGPSAGPNGAASSLFTLTPTGGVYTGTITLSMTGLAGTWTPTSLAWSGDAAAKTATFTPSATGTGTANGTGSPALTQPAGVSFISKATTTRTYTVDGGTPATTTGILVNNADATRWAERVTSTTDQGGGSYSKSGRLVPSDLSGVVQWDQGSGPLATDPVDNRPANPFVIGG